MTLDELITDLNAAGANENTIRLAMNCYALGVLTEREACAKLIEPDEEHRRDASWGYLGGDDGVELLDGAAAKIRERGQQ